MNLSVPSQFGKYLLLEKIASGGMAEVFKAKITGEHGFEKIIIIKRIFPHLQTQTELVEAFIDEAKIAALLQHENIVQIYDFGKVHDSYFIAMEYLAGSNLKAILDKAGSKGRIDLDIALYIASKLCAGMHYAHHLKDLQGNPLNIVHRDVSPPNIMVTFEGQVKIIDFGIAKAASQNKATQMGIIKGKVAYMSPEQADGRALDHRSDIFSLGSLLYEMLTGFPVYDGETMTILAKAREARFRSIQEIRHDLPDSVIQIIDRALQKDVNHRYGSAGDMRDDIEQSIVTLGLYPSGHRLSKFIKKLFKDEMLAAESFIMGPSRNSMSVKPSSPVDATPDEKPVLSALPAEETDSYEETKFIKTDNYWQQNQQKLISIGLTIIFLSAVCLYFVLFHKKNIPSTQQVPGAVTQVFEPSRPYPASVEPSPESLGVTAFKEKRYHDAVIQFEQLFSEKPSTRKQFKLPYIEALLGAASESSDYDPSLAKILLMKVIETDPERIQAYFQLGLIYVKIADYNNAIETYKKVISLDNDFSDAFFNLGYVYAVNKDYTNAEAMYQRVVDLEPVYLDEALFNLAVIQNRLGSNEKAVINLKHALSINPDNMMAKNFLAKVNNALGENR